MSDHDENDEIEGLDVDPAGALEEALEMDTQSQIFLELRRQNLDLLKVAVEMAGFGGSHPPLKSGDMKGAMKTLWDVYSEFHAWIDPEEGDDDDDEDDEL